MLPNAMLTTAHTHAHTHTRTHTQATSSIFALHGCNRINRCPLCCRLPALINLTTVYLVNHVPPQYARDGFQHVVRHRRVLESPKTFDHLQTTNSKIENSYEFMKSPKQIWLQALYLSGGWRDTCRYMTRAIHTSSCAFHTKIIPQLTMNHSQQLGFLTAN